MLLWCTRVHHIRSDSIAIGIPIGNWCLLMSGRLVIYIFIKMLNVNNTYIYIYIYIYICVYVCIYIYMCVYVYICMCVYV